MTRDIAPSTAHGDVGDIFWIAYAKNWKHRQRGPSGTAMVSRSALVMIVSGGLFSYPPTFQCV